MVRLLKKGKGIQRIPMSGLKELEKAGAKFGRMTGNKLELGKIRAEIRKRKR